MKPLIVAPTSQTPGVDFNAETGLLKIEGRSWSEDVNQFYVPLNDWLNEYIGSTESDTNFEVSLDYFNSASSKLIYQLFTKLTQLVDRGYKLTIDWRYQSNDEEMLEVGKEYRAAIQCSSELYEFKLVCID